jgi:PAS domain S-box-containing protein
MAASFQGFRSLIENSPDAISLIDTQGEILYGSASTTKLFGYRPEELVGRNCLDLIHPEDRDHSSRALQEVLAKPPGPLQWDARVRHKNGNYCWVESTVSNLLLESEVRAIVVHQRDINARRAAEVERERHAEELARSNLRLEEFAYTAAHDLREPLRAISAYTEMLVQKTQMDPDAQQMANFIVDGAARMSTLVDDLLSFASSGMQEPPRCVDLQHAVAQATQNLGLAIKASGAMVTVDRLPIVLSNEIQLVRLFQNLISNAVKYRGEDPVKIHVSAERRGLDWVIRIKDNGLGIALENQARVFLPFIRLANRDVPGTGLGLAVCKKIVEGQGGTIWVESGSGAGSTFCFTIAGTGEELLVPTTPKRAAA